MIHSEKFQKQYMNLAKAVAKENTACLSRSLGTIIVDSNHKIKGTGRNGVPHNVPHSDSRESLKDYFWPLLEDIDIESLRLMFNTVTDNATCDVFLDHYTGAGICPRKILGCDTGQRPELCNCTHSEVNAIANAACDISDCAMYTASPIPCINCAGLIINARIKEVHCYNVVYHKQSVWMFEQANIDLMLYDV